jgi:hydroxymethylbilane synthase
MKRLIRVGSRESKLAVTQTQSIINIIKTHHPELEFEIVTMKTSGDMILDRNLDEVGGKGLFVKELDIGLRSGQIDFAVHSLKDMPMLTPEDLPVVSLSVRENPYDALVLPRKAGEVDLTKPFGCSSARRKLQLERLYPGIAVKGIRGNVQLRLQKVDSGDYAATILACAGLNRMGLQHRISKVFTEKDMIPAAGQGILAIQVRAGEDHTYLRCVNDPASQIAFNAERAFVRRLDGGCSSPIAAYAKISGGQVILHGLHYDEETGRHAVGVMEMSVAEAEKLGITLAEQLLAKLSSAKGAVI